MVAASSGVIARAFALLGCFDSGSASLSLSDLARLTGMPLNTTLRIARSLIREGALDRDDEGRFSIGMRLYELGSLESRGLALRHAALRHLYDLHALTGHHALLTIREGDYAILLERLSPREGASRVEYRIGGRMPLSATGGGLVLLASAPRDVHEHAIESFDPRSVLDGIDTADDLRRFLSATRRTGQVIGTRRLPDPRATVAVPLQDDHGRTVAALSIVYTVGHAEATDLLPALRRCARSILRPDRAHRQSTT